MKNRSCALALAATLLAGAPLGVRAQAPPPLLPPPPPPPPPGVGDNPNGGAIPAPPDIPATPGTPGAPAAPPAPGVILPDLSSQPNGARTLRYKFRPGQTIRYSLSLDCDGTLQAGSATATPERQHTDLMLHQTVKGIRASDGAATLATQIDSVRVTVNGSPVPLSPKSQQQMKQVITTVVSPTGRVLSFERPADIGIAGLPINPLEFQSLNALADNPTSVIVTILPTEAVSPSDTWRSNYVTTVGTLEEHTASTLKGTSVAGGHTVAAIAQKIYMAFKPPKSGAPGPSVPRLTGLVTGTGTEQFNVDAGEISSATNIMQINLKSTPPRAGAPDAATAVTAKMEVRSTLTRVNEAGTPVPPVGPGPGLPPLPTANPADEPPTGQLQ